MLTVRSMSQKQNPARCGSTCLESQHLTSKDRLSRLDWFTGEFQNSEGYVENVPVSKNINNLEAQGPRY